MLANISNVIAFSH